MLYDGFLFVFDGWDYRIDLYKLIGKRVMVYGQIEMMYDFMD
ncbi:4-hydroxybenzoate 3-monooxygenase, partial [Bacillus sp. MBGLi97]